MKAEKPRKGGRYVRDAATGKLSAAIGPGPKTGAAAPAPQTDAKPDAKPDRKGKGN